MKSKDTDLGFVKASKNRIKILKVLSKCKYTPTQLAKKTKIQTPNISKYLKELESRGIIECTTGGLKKGKLYEITDKGCKILKEI